MKSEVSQNPTYRMSAHGMREILLPT